MSESDSKYEFQEIVDGYNALITKICYYFANNRDEFNDLRQETLINLWKGLSSFNSNSKLSTWIYRVCFNSCVSYNRKYRNHRDHISISSIADIKAWDAFDIEQYNELHRLIGRLKPQDKTLILLWLDEKSYEEIAEITGLNRNTVGVRLSRIKERLITMSNQ